MLILLLPQENYRTAIHTEGMVKDLVKNLSNGNDELQMHCASAIFKVLAFLFCVQWVPFFFASYLCKKQILKNKNGLKFFFKISPP